jgi:glutaminyl-tRNA synthetase
VELRCTYDPATRGGDAPDGRRPRATLHWVAAGHAVPAEIRLYDHLFSRPDPGADGDVFADLAPDSETVVRGAWLEPSLADIATGTTVQFERLGYFAPDPDSAPGALVFDRTLTLKDTWAKVQARGGGSRSMDGS